MEKWSYLVGRFSKQENILIWKQWRKTSVFSFHNWWYLLHTQNTDIHLSLPGKLLNVPFGARVVWVASIITPYLRSDYSFVRQIAVALFALIEAWLLEQKVKLTVSREAILNYIEQSELGKLPDIAFLTKDAIFSKQFSCPTSPHLPYPFRMVAIKCNRFGRRAAVNGKLISTINIYCEWWLCRNGTVAAKWFAEAWVLQRVYLSGEFLWNHNGSDQAANWKFLFDLLTNEDLVRQNCSLKTCWTI